MTKYFNYSHIEHIAIAVSVQVIIGLLTGDWWTGAAAGSFLFIGREITQAEYRWIKQLGQGKRANIPRFGGLDPKVWKWTENSDSWLDWVLPAVTTVIIAILIEVV